MSSIIDFSEALKNAIQYGQAVDGNTVRQIVADNGEEIGKGIYQVVNGGNGTSQGIWTTVVATAQGFLTTGLSYMAVSLPTACAALAPCLGVIAGAGLYSVAPNFFDRIGNALYNAGATLNGKVLAYFDGNNMYFTKQAIEAFKNELLDMGVFDNGEKSCEDFELTSVSQPIPFSTMANLFREEDGEMVQFSYWCAGGYATQWKRDPNNDNSTWYQQLVASSDSNALAYSYRSDSGNPDGWNGAPLSHSFTYDNKTVYYVTRSGGYIAQPFAYNPSINTTNGVNSADYDEIAWIMIYGTGTNPNVNLQPDALYPNDEEFPLRYPEWYPLNYPDGQTEDFPEVYPAKYPDIDPNEQPNQKEAQNPDPEDPNEFPIIIPDFDIPEPNINPDPVEDEDYDPDYDPEYDPDDDEDPTTPDPDPDENVEQDEDEKFDNPDPDVPDEPDPVDPNTGDDVITPVIPPITLPDTVSSNKLFTVYNPSMSQLNALGAYLWDSSLMETIKKIWQNPLDGVISLIQVYATPITGGSSNIILGYLDSGVSAPVVSSQFVSVDCGSVTLAEKKKNATDYSPYTALSIYLPFIGITELDVDECMGATINVTYKIDVYTGTCLALVKITRAKDLKNGGILYTYNGNCSQQLPLTSGDATGVLSSLIGAVGSGLAIASGGGLGLVAGANLIGNSLNHEMLHVSHSGNISANAGIMGDKNPYLIISRVHSYDANAYNTYYGYPANKTVYLANCNGFIKVKDVHLQTSATDTERTEIERLLHEGIIL